MPLIGELDLAEQHADDRKAEPEPHAVDDRRNERRQVDLAESSDARDALKLRPTRTNTGSMRRTAAATVSATGKERRERAERGLRRRPDAEEQNRDRKEHDLRRRRDAVEIRTDRLTQPRPRTDRRCRQSTPSTVATTKPTAISADRHGEIRIRRRIGEQRDERCADFTERRHDAGIEQMRAREQFVCARARRRS